MDNIIVFLISLTAGVYLLYKGYRFLVKKEVRCCYGYTYLYKMKSEKRKAEQD